MKRKMLAIVISLTIGATMLTGCGGDRTPDPVEASTASISEAEAGSVSYVANSATEVVSESEMVDSESRKTTQQLITFRLPPDYFTIDGIQDSNQEQLDQYSVNGLRYEQMGDHILCTVENQEVALKSVKNAIYADMNDFKNAGEYTYIESYQEIWFDEPDELRKITILCDGEKWKPGDERFGKVFAERAKMYQRILGHPEEQTNCDIQFVDANNKDQPIVLWPILGEN